MNGTVDMSIKTKIKIPDGEYEGEFYLFSILSRTKFCYSVLLTLTLA